MSHRRTFAAAAALPGLVVETWILLPLAMWAGLATGDLTTDAWRLLDTRLLGVDWAVDGWLTPLLVLAGVLLLIVTLHLARGIGYLHGVFAKHMLVKSARV